MEKETTLQDRSLKIEAAHLNNSPAHHGDYQDYWKEVEVLVQKNIINKSTEVRDEVLTTVDFTKLKN